MSEFIGLAYYTETPAVFYDIQRTGPSTGMPTRTQQGDFLSIAYASHGDTKHIMIFPRDPEECFSMSVESFDLAERFQTPVFVVSDLDIGMNDWMCPRLKWSDKFRPDRGKVLGPAELEKIKKFNRYLDLDGDGIAARTLPGQDAKGAFFSRGSGHDKYGAYTEESDAYKEVVDRIARKINGSAESLPAPEFTKQKGAKIGLVSIGGCDAAVREASRRIARAGHEGGLHAHPRLPLREVGAGIPRIPRTHLRDRAEPRRAAPLSTHDRDRLPPRQHDPCPGLRRPPPHGEGSRRCSYAF